MGGFKLPVRGDTDPEKARAHETQNDKSQEMASCKTGGCNTTHEINNTMGRKNLAVRELTDFLKMRLRTKFSYAACRKTGGRNPRGNARVAWRPRGGHSGNRVGVRKKPGDDTWGTPGGDESRLGGVVWGRGRKGKKKKLPGGGLTGRGTRN